MFGSYWILWKKFIIENSIKKKSIKSELNILEFTLGPTAKVTLVEWERGSPSPPSVNKSHPTQQHVFDSGKKIRWRKWGSPFIIPNNFYFLSPPRFGSEAPPSDTPKSSSLAEGLPENKHFDGGRAEFPTQLNTVWHESPKDVRMLFSSK